MFKKLAMAYALKQITAMAQDRVLHLPDARVSEIAARHGIPPIVVRQLNDEVVSRLLAGIERSHR